MSTYTVELTYGARYTIGGFATEDEAMEFVAKYRGNERRMEKDFDDLPYGGSRRDLDHDLNLVSITKNGEEQ